MKAADSAYAKAARQQDATGRHGTPPELAAQRAMQDIALGAMRKDFDTSAKDNHAKYERFHFAVIGEGSRRALDAYRKGYDRIDWTI